MHPNLVTIPGINFTVPSWGFCVVVGFLLAMWIGVRRAKRIGADPAAVTSITLVGGVLGFLGCRMMYVVHHLGGVAGASRLGLRGATSLSAGGEILGGVLLGFAGVVVYLLATRKPLRLYLDLMLPVVILAMGIGRIGCLLAGCCFGSICETGVGAKALPWAIRFPYGSPAYLRQWRDGQVHPPAELLVPGLWLANPVKLQDSDPAPIPPELMHAAEPGDNPTLAEFADGVFARKALRQQEPDNPALTALDDRLRSLQDSLPGSTARERIGNLTVACHLHRLNEAVPTDRPITVAELRKSATLEQSRWVHPTQVYDLVTLILMFFVLSAIFWRQRRQGTVIAWTVILYSASRFLQEAIRADNPQDVFGRLTISQAMSIGLFVAGLVFLLLVLKVLPPRSRRTPTPPLRAL